MYDVMQTRQL